VFQTGSVVEQGTHDELIAKNGVYAQLVAIQMGKGADEEELERKKALEAREYEKKVQRALMPWGRGGGLDGLKAAGPVLFGTIVALARGFGLNCAYRVSADKQ
jgi:hypothetical protein